MSKGFPIGKVAETALPIRPQQVLEQNRIEPILGVRAAAIDRTSRTVSLSDGRSLTYGRLALATGCRPRPVPRADLEGVLYLRTLDDAIALKARMPEAKSVAIIGGGFIGLEIAASLAMIGKEVTVIEALPRVLARALPERVSDFLTDVHRRASVTVRTGTTVRELEGVGGHVRSVLLSDGTRCPADFVIVGIGVLPNVELAAEADLACRDGIVIDEFARTSDPTVVAAGDCTRHPNRFAPAGAIRLELVQNALDQAKTAGGAIVGSLKAYDAVPWFWSDQYDLKLQMVGLSEGHDQAVVRGSPEEQKFSIFYFRKGALIGNPFYQSPRRSHGRPPAHPSRRPAHAGAGRRSWLRSCALRHRRTQSHPRASGVRLLSPKFLELRRDHILVAGSASGFRIARELVHAGDKSGEIVAS